MRKIFIIFVILVCVELYDGLLTVDSDIKDDECPRKLSELEICELEQEMRRKVKCPEGQLPDHNGKCREIWVFSYKHCPDEYRPGENGKCNEVYLFNVIGVPTYCEEGYRWYNGKCRRVF